MAGDWIKLEHATPDKPEVFRMAEILGIDPDMVVGKLIRFWRWCDQQTVDGDALQVSDLVIDRLTHQPGFSAALREVSWLQARSGSLAIPNFARHNGQTAKARAVENRRKSENRNDNREMSEKCPGQTGTKAGQKPGPEKRREEKRRENAEPEGAVAPGVGSIVPLLLDTPEFRQAWADWLQHRKEKRKPVTPLSAKQSLTELEAMGPDRATAAIRHSIGKGWTGIFEPDRPAAGATAGYTNRHQQAAPTAAEHMDPNAWEFHAANK